MSGRSADLKSQIADFIDQYFKLEIMDLKCG